MKDYLKASVWHKKVAEQGDKIAQHKLGLIYEEGRGKVAQSYDEAFRWYQKAAEKGHRGAKLRIDQYQFRTKL